MHTPRKLSVFGSRNKSLIVYLLIPLSLSALTHMWNPIGFPTYHVDEGHYMRRAMQVISGLGPQETNQTYEYGYDHPFFGQIFLASSLSLLNYPDSVNPSINKQSIENLFLVPRIIMGILAVVDTFLVYKIAETRYNKRVAFIASTLFAVMPLTTILRGILLDSIEVPFILLSILFAIYFSKCVNQVSSLNANITNNKNLLILLSGIFLGLAIFTKVPVFTMIPLIAFILLEKYILNLKGALTTKSTVKSLAMWLIPVTLIPIMWPAYAVSVGQFDDWVNGVLYQAGREGNADLLRSFTIVTQIDPILVILGFASIIYTTLRKDLFPLVWMLPYLIFLYLIGWVTYFHWSIFLPILCIALGTVAESLTKRLEAHKSIQFFPFVLASGIAIFGLLSISFLFTSNLNAVYTDVYFVVTRELHNNDAKMDIQGVEDNGTTLIGSHRIRAFVWIPKYVFADAVTFRDTDLPNDNFTKPIQTAKFLVVADSNLLNEFAQMNPDEKYSKIASLYYNTSQTIATFIDENELKNNLLNLRENHGLGTFVEIKANY